LIRGPDETDTWFPYTDGRVYITAPKRATDGLAGEIVLRIRDIDAGTYVELARLLSDGALKIKGNFLPFTDGAQDLGDGTTPLRWKDLHLSGKAYIGAGGIIESTVSDNIHLKTASDSPNPNIAIYFGDTPYYAFQKTVFRPETSGGADLGSPSYKWRDLHLAGKINGLKLALKTGGVLGFWYDLRAESRNLAKGRLVEVSEHSKIDFTDYNPQGIADYFGCRIVGFISPRYSETYTFYVTSDDGVRVWFNGKLVVDAWKDQGATTYSWTADLEADKWYPIVIEHYEHGGTERLCLEWESASQAREVIPGERLAYSSLDYVALLKVLWGDIGIVAGKILFGDYPSGAKFDVNLYRAGADVLKTDDNFEVGGVIRGPTTEDIDHFSYGASRYYGIMVRNAWHTIRTHSGAHGTRISKWDGTTLTDLFVVENNGITRPGSDNAYDLGSSSYRWKDGWFAGGLAVGDITSRADRLHVKSGPNSGILVESTGDHPAITLKGYDGTNYYSTKIVGGYHGRAVEWHQPESGRYFMFSAPSATSDNPLQNCWMLLFRCRYWDGSASRIFEMQIIPELLDTSPTGRLRFSLTGPGDILELHSSDGIIAHMDLKPYSDNAYDLGSSSYRWRDAYIGRNLIGGRLNLTVNKITSKDLTSDASGSSYIDPSVSDRAFLLTYVRIYASLTDTANNMVDSKVLELTDINSIIDKIGDGKRVVRIRMEYSVTGIGTVEGSATTKAYAVLEDGTEVELGSVTASGMASVGETIKVSGHSVRIKGYEN